MYTAGTFSVRFCGLHEVQKFFYNVHSLLKFSGFGTHVVVDTSATIGANFGYISFVSIVVSYACIFRALLRMPAAESRAKAFSSCLPHLVMVTIFLCMAAISYLKPMSDSSLALDILVSMFYAVVFLMVLFAGSELFVLTAMSYDSYVAIYHPLRYRVVANHGDCVSGSGTHVVTDTSVSIGANFGFISLVSIVVLYAHIFRAMLWMPSSKAWTKAFSTCLPHLIVVTIFISTATIAYFKPV
ncbi:olfactory receptor 14K1-like [Tachyglossus aculeatus]|uniref:olfactory receptor 14K1-like n=1 Tax=Tachyglossus aculeatus TaxID=9261 RepID=UPI0018F725A6|nr:olfactory receptor 14K1-like [Tachyglossus aculeatus]